MKKKTITDKQRMDFMERQGFTRWVGWGTSERCTVWPVFEKDSFRSEVDRAMRAANELGKSE